MVTFRAINSRDAEVGLNGTDPATIYASIGKDKDATFYFLKIYWLGTMSLFRVVCKDLGSLM